MKRSLNYSVFFTIFLGLSISVESLTVATPTTRKHFPKGETLTLVVPPQSPSPSTGQGLNWDPDRGQAGPVIRSLNPNALSRRGDDGVVDSRGTVRYNFLPNGRLAKGIITYPADETAPYAQASGKF